ncbi:uncharacterized protein I303_106786 [Kwoniella dejecticola CBS 10117]|uniref:ZZ-type domain-containing protein n=1 Tax=Kwoniella dejecticola CBS 10117 TaxID=1296121 RepID=A0A1A5ZTQ1_9TREE|nr:uncharacterized protein I303_08572 [Kwoniella dejecticola CBS 10117]OBR81187.1 hypothetical protein I303_08572 [Kwoniella dejecticola CBS 10117]
MYGSSSGSIPDRPNRPLIIKCAFDGSARRVTFPSAATCRLESLRNRVEECFALSASPFSLAYTDDDGEEFFIKSETDLTEAIHYYVSGDDDAAASFHSGSNSGRMTYGFAAQKIVLRLDVLVEYDGPSLSDTSSISSFRTGTNSFSDSGTEAKSQGTLRSSFYAETLGSGSSGQERSIGGSGTSGRDSTLHQFSLLNLEADDGQDRDLSGSATPREPYIVPSAPILTGPESDPAPSLLTHSDLGTRWLREQSRLASRKLGPAPKSLARSGDYDSDEDSYGSDEEPGEIALVRDARGRYYYSYQTDASSRSSVSEAGYTEHEAGPSVRRISGMPSDFTLSTSPPKTPDLPYDPVRVAEPAGPPILAPDCSACGIRLDYMRYVCRTCGEGEFWRQDAPGKAKFVPPVRNSDSDPSDGSSSEGTEWAPGRASSNGSQTVYNVANPRHRSDSSSTNESSGSMQATFGGQSSPTTAMYRYGNGPTPPDSPNSTNQNLPKVKTAKPHGYELCAGCIEVHGIAHTKAAARAAKRDLTHAERRRLRAAGESRHSFIEKIWAAEGWVDVEYNEDLECTMCRHPLFKNRFKCVSCSNFNLCRTCYHKADEIHSAHAFLSLPDKTLPLLDGLGLQPRDPPERPHLIPVPMRHPGAFCHNCLQDIVGPRFHCAVCAVDLCIQCEAVVSDFNGTSHTADHIMMKIPVPISSHEVDAVSRRARDRWLQQDRTVAVSGPDPFQDDAGGSSRSSSPTNDTVYAPTADRNGAATQQVIGVTTPDALDHGMKCGNCHQWIMGRRYQCANCPSEPEGFNLCSICELRSYKVHDPTHIFLKLDRPVQIPIRSSTPVLPLLYRHPVGKVPTSALATINPRDPTAYLQHLLHRETLCDVHGDQIRGVWLRCCHCAAGFDVCQEAEKVLDHDPTHVFAVFKSRVDMSAFRTLANLEATHAKPLLDQQVYFS